MIWGRLFGLAFVASLVTAGTYHHPHGHNDPNTPSAKTIDGNYILQFESHLAHAQAHDFLRAHNVQYEVQHDYTAIFHGTAIRLLSDHDGPTLAQIPGIKNVWPTTIHKRPTIVNPVAPSVASADSADSADSDNSAMAHTLIRRRAVSPRGGYPDAASYTLHHMTGVNVLHDKYKLTGKGIKVGIIDSGIDYKHPAFALPGATEGCFGTSPDGTPCRVAFGYDFVGGDNSTDPNRPTEDADPMDCDGHGTHVAGIAGADARSLAKGVGPHPPRPFVGVAPEVTFGAYRVLDCEGQGSTPAILAGIHRAVEDKMDIINLSLGQGSAFKTDPVTVALEDVALKGSLVVGAAGNDGAEGIGMVSEVGLGDNALSTASFDNVYIYYPSFGIAGKKYPYLISGVPKTLLQVKGPTYLYPLVDDKGQLLSVCDEAAYAGLKGQKEANLVIVGNSSLTTCTLDQLRPLAISHGAVAVFFSLGVEDIEYDEDLASNEAPTMGIIRMSSIKEIIANNKLATITKTPITWSTGEDPFLYPNSGAPALMSSFGMDGELRSKPDLGAPGGKILSTYPLDKGGYKVDSGTSMATPYISGSYALYLQSKKYAKISSLNIRTIFKNTATIYSRPGSRSMPVSSVKQGAGLINALKAVMTTTTITPDHIDLLDSAHFKSKVTIVLTNSGKKVEKYRLSHRPAETLNSYPNGNTFPLKTPLIERHAAKVTFPGSGLVRVNPGQSVNITLRFKEPTGANPAQFPLYSGFIIATPTRDRKGVAVHVPYTGMRGLAAKVPIFDTNAKYPRLLNFNTTDGKEMELKVDSNGHPVFDRQAGYIGLAFRLGSHSPRVHATVYHANDTKTPLGIPSCETASSDGGFLPLVDTFTRNKDLDQDGQPITIKYVWRGSVFPMDMLKDENENSNDNSTMKPTLLEAGSYRVVVSAQKILTTGQKKKDFVNYDLGVVTLL